MADAASNSADASVYKQPLQLHEIATLHGHTDEIGHLHFSPDATRLIALPRTGKAKLWDVWRHKPIAYLDTHHDDTSRCAFSPDSELLAIGGKDGIVRLWTRDGELLAALPGHTLLGTNLAFSWDEGILITGDEAGCIRLWNWAAEQVVYTFSAFERTFRGGRLTENKPLLESNIPTKKKSYLYSMTTSPDETIRAIIYTLYEGLLRSWVINTTIPGAELVKTLTSSIGPSTTPDQFVFSSDSRYLAAICRSLDVPAIQLYDTSTFTPVSLIQPSSKNSFRDAIFSPDSRFLAIANSSGPASDWKGLIQIWDIASRNYITSVGAFPDPGYAQYWPICSIDWAQNNSLIATGGWDATGEGDFENAMVIKLWEVQET